MPNELSFEKFPDDRYLANLYRLQVRELEDYALFLADLSGHMITWNRGVEKAFGYTEDEWIGQNVSIIFTEEDRAAGVPEGEMRTAAEKGRSVDIRWHKRKDGVRVFMTGILKALRDEQNNLIGYSKIVLDETARKRLEDALNQSNADLQQFAFVASHDLQEPLRMMVSFSELLAQRYRGKLEEDADEFLQTIVNAGHQMSALIRDLLVYSQLANEEIPATSVHLDDDLESALSLLRIRIEESGAVITHDPLPDVRIARGQMIRLFQNLIGNSIKFRKSDEPLHIHISAEEQEKEWTIRVQDNGIGFAQGDAQHLFAPFKRLHPAHKYPGTGLGLASCRRIVERYGGRIGVDSRPGVGSRFWFTIPAELVLIWQPSSGVTDQQR